MADSILKCPSFVKVQSVAMSAIRRQRTAEARDGSRGGDVGDASPPPALPNILMPQKSNMRTFFSRNGICIPPIKDVFWGGDMFHQIAVCVCVWGG